MAEKGYSKRKDSWNCPICLDVFNRPRSLPCLHTFCTNCLHGHITKSSQRLSQFKCPVCRADVQPPRTYTGRVNWAKQFPINHWLVSMMDEEQLRDDLELHETKNCCEVHPDLTIKLFCLDHQALCCPMCVATDHRRCDEVREITEILDDWNVVKETDDVQRTLSVTKNSVDELNKTRHEQKLAALGNKDAIIGKISDEKEKIVRHFDKLSAVLFESVETKYNEINKCIQDDLKRRVDTDKIVDESKALIAKIEQDPSAKVNAFILIAQVQSKCRNIVETICKTEITVENETIDCCINENVLNIETLVPSFGELVIVHEERAELEADLDTTVTRGDSLSLSMETTEPIRDFGIPGDNDDEIVNTADVESNSVWYPLISGVCAVFWDYLFTWSVDNHL